MELLDLPLPEVEALVRAVAAALLPQPVTALDLARMRAARPSHLPTQLEVCVFADHQALVIRRCHAAGGMRVRESSGADHQALIITALFTSALTCDERLLKRLHPPHRLTQPRCQLPSMTSCHTSRTARVLDAQCSGRSAGIGWLSASV